MYKVLKSAVADTDNLKMTPEIEQELNKIYKKKEGIDMKKSSENAFNVLVGSLVEEYKDTKKLEIQKNIEGYSSREDVIITLAGIQSKFIHSKNQLINCICQFMGTNGWQDLSYFYSDSYDMPILTVNDEDYEECLLNWVNDLEKHLFDLYILVISYRKENINTLMQCYIETTILCKKLQYVLDQSIADFESMTSEEKKLYNISFQDLEYVKNIYNSILENITGLVFDLFNYINTYEQIDKNVTSNETTNN